VPIDEIRDAARLVEWGLHPRVLPEADATYRALVRRWLDEGAFRAQVEAVADGLKLRVVAVHLRAGIVLGTQSESVFAYTITRFRKHVANEEGAVIALVLVASCATFYPHEESLDVEDMAAPTARLSEVRDHLVKLCSTLESQHRRGGETVAERWRKGWQQLLAIPQINEDAKRISRTHLHGIVHLVLKHLAESGLAAEEQRLDGDHLYVATPRLRLMLAEHASVPLLDIAREAIHRA
jgi:hypothetical protein